MVLQSRGFHDWNHHLKDLIFLRSVQSHLCPILVLQGLCVHAEPDFLQCQVLQKQCRRMSPPIRVGGLFQVAAIEDWGLCAGVAATAAVPAGQRACQHRCRQADAARGHCSRDMGRKGE